MTDDLETTPRSLYRNRRQVIQRLVALGLCPFAFPALGEQEAHEQDEADDSITPAASALNYNNYYEFSTNKEAVAVLAQDFTTDSWQVRIDGEVEQPVTLNLPDILALGTVQRTYRLRCVEGWSMVLPWEGVPLQALLAKVRPKATARFVRFTGTLRPEEMVNQRRPVLPWPYIEGLRLDEALHPLTLLATGLYGDPLPKQSGEPLRLLVPWKYAFKSIKAITRIELTRDQPSTSWQQQNPSEYGFYANVNPDVPHPRWSQKREARIGELRKRPTLPFNGYSTEVAHLYAGMDLAKDF
ncbi:oxidoreductase, molybdopterin-binding protein [gamma proteobacterium HdN1]|nr:oxidoreductase, molybdopterin-binding protein [gamma proteobacterium HdN1]